VLLLVAVLVAATALLVRYWLLPHIDDYRGEIAAAISRAAHQRITIGGLEGDWDGYRPRLVIRDLRVYDRAGAERLALASVDGTLSWMSLLGEVRFHAIEADRLALEVRRDERGVFSIAGIALDQGGDGEGGFGDWLLAQNRIAVRKSTLTWIDETLGGLPLQLSNVDLLVDRRLGGWRVGLQAAPPIEAASPIDLRADLKRDRLGGQRVWRGRVYLAVTYADLVTLGHWLPLPPDVERGAGGMELWADLAESRVTNVIADVHLSDVSLRLRSDLPYLDLARLTGRIGWTRIGDSVTWSARDLSFTAPDGLELPPADLTYRRAGAEDDPNARSDVRFDALDLAAVVRLVDRLPLDEALRQRLAELDPRGTLHGFDLSWTGRLGEGSQYAARGSFERIAVSPSGYLPGFSSVSGQLDADQRGGRLSLRAQGAELAMPKVFAAPLPVQELSAKLSWTMQAGLPAVRVESLALSNAHMAAKASGTYRAVADGPGTLELAGSMQHGEGHEAWRYLPLKMHPQLREWLQRSIVAARMHDVRFRLSGDLHLFPFTHGRPGSFEAVVPFDAATLAFDPHWPALEGLRGELAFRNASLDVHIEDGRTFGVRLRSATASIADLGADHPVSEIRGTAEGPTADFLRVVAASPVTRMIGGFTQDMQASGNGMLSLTAALPLKDIDQATVAGRYTFLSNTLEPGHGAPRLEQLNGQLVFDAKDVRLQDGSARVLRMPVRFSAERVPGSRGVLFRGSGRADVPALRALVDEPWVNALSGAADWQGVLRVEGGGYDLTLDSDLRGLGSALPAPLTKLASAPQRFTLQRRSQPGGRELTSVNLGNLFSMQRMEARDGTQPSRVEVRLGEPAPLPQREGVWLGGRVAALDVDRWRSLIPAGGSGRSAGAGAEPGGRGGISLSGDSVVLFDREWHDVQFQAVQKDGQWQGQVSAREAVGSVGWSSAGSGSVQARLTRLALPDKISTVHQADSGVPPELPALDITADDFRAGERAFGKLTLLAQPEGRDWRVRQLELKSPEGTLSANGVWRAGSPPVARLDVQVDVRDIGAFLARLQLPRGVAGGSGKLTGQLAWNGSPQSVDLQSLSGTVRLEARQGRFVRIEPGIGKLIGVLSLQALPRRAALDFRDIFSEGFAFDSISATAVVDRGTARTRDFRMAGPAARVEMSGEVNLPGETQRLDVRVMPSLSEGIALGAAIVNPAVGLATLLAQKALKDPVGKIVAFEYEVSGTWADPMVMKKRREAPEDGRQGRK
jgi:uncharacterized protein (TIGR02099 family)